ncbi:MAG: Crp/Fnr family transcriptional regulator [Cyclobacteriaceae bacterium]
MKEIIEKSLLGIPLEPELVKEIISVGRQKKVKQGDLVAGSQLDIDEIPFIIDGLYRVARPDGQGGELFLYYLEGGNTCAMSITCCIEKKRAEVSMTCEEDGHVWMVPMAYMDRWVEKYRSFRKYVFRSYQDRFDELLYAVDNVAFMKMDERLMNYLLDRKQATGSFEILLTHEQIARDLNSSRVVISRLLKRLERDGEVMLHRNKIEIL